MKRVPLLLIELILVMGLPAAETASKSWTLGLASALMVALGYPGEIQSNPSGRWMWWFFVLQLLELLVQYKWSENVWPKWRMLVVGYLMSLGLATTAMISSAAQSRDGSEASMWVDGLQVACGLVEAIVLCYQIHHVV